VDGFWASPVRDAEPIIRPSPRDVERKCQGAADYDVARADLQGIVGSGLRPNGLSVEDGRNPVEDACVNLTFLRPWQNGVEELCSSS
jgi:hypothetical protein